MERMRLKRNPRRLKRGRYICKQRSKKQKRLRRKATRNQESLKGESVFYAGRKGSVPRAGLGGPSCQLQRPPEMKLVGGGGLDSGPVSRKGGGNLSTVTIAGFL